MKIQPYYAFLEGIQRKIKHATSAILALTNRKVVAKFEYEEGGLCELIMITVNHPDIQVKLRFDEDSWEWTPQQLQNYGLTEPNPYGVWLGQYDNANDYYTIMFVPQNLLSFKSGLFLETFYATAAYNVVQYETIVYEVINQDAFLTSLKSLSAQTVAREITQSRERIIPPRVVTPPRRDWSWRDR